jgi:cytochrome c peroxidase
MLMRPKYLLAVFAGPMLLAGSALYASPADDTHRLSPEQFKEWILPAEPPYPANNKPSAERVSLGKMLFFDPRLSRDSTLSCASCHSPMFGWSDGVGVSLGFHGKPMERASPPITNTGYSTSQMWDGRKKELEDQVMGPMLSGGIMNTDVENFFKWLNTSDEYKTAFNKAYPGEPINAATLSKAIASFERTIISRDSAFDRWVAGDQRALTPQQLRGMSVFMNKGNCASCHSAPNFSDNGFHNIGLASFGKEKPDMGRYAQRPVALMKGAFKTPSLRDVEYSAPYFHDGSAKTLTEVVEHYDKGGEVRTNLSPGMKTLNLSAAEKEDLVAFLKALSSPRAKVEFPVLPPN